MTWQDNMRNAQSPDGVIAAGSGETLPANNPNWEDYMRASWTEEGLKLVGGGGGGAAVIIKGHFDTAEELPETAEVGDAYTVGTEKPYDVYIYGEDEEWQNIGPIQGPKGDRGPQGPKGDPGAGAVESVNGKTGVVVLAASDINAQNSQSIQANLERIDETAEQTIDDLAVVEAIAKGAQRAIVYGDYETFVTAFNALDGTEYNAGQNVMIVTVDVPDLWISSVEETSVPYTYTTDEAIIEALETTGYIQVGYYKVSQLETGKVDLTNYVKNTDYAGATTGGVVKVHASNGLKVTAGMLSGASRTLAEYTASNDDLNIAKGTLENVIAGKGIISTITLTQAEYDALTTYADNTNYQIIE